MSTERIPSTMMLMRMYPMSGLFVASKKKYDVPASTAVTPPMVMYASDVPGADEVAVASGACVLVVIGIGESPAREERIGVPLHRDLEAKRPAVTWNEVSQMLQVPCQSSAG